MPRKATGTLIWYEKGWHGRYWATIDGERKRQFVDLETKNEALARERLDTLIRAEASSTAPVGIETFAAAAERVLQERARTLRSAKGQRSYMTNHVLPVIGRMPVTDITTRDVCMVLERVRDAGLSTQTIIHVRNAIAAVFRKLRREHVVTELPIPSTDELPECLPEAIDDRPKAVLSDDELLLYLRYTDPRRGERFRGAVRERQMMALLSRCVGGMRTGELHGLTWARASVENERFEALEVVRYKTRRKATRHGSKAASRQLYPLGDTVLPLFLRYWWVRSGRPGGDALLFPVRRAQRAGAISRPGDQRVASTWAGALRRDLQRAFEQALGAGVQDVPGPGSRRWSELFAGTEDRRPLWFHNSRNAAAVVAERLERLNAAARVTGHASGQMLQRYREMAGEVDVVPVVPAFLPDTDALLAVLAAWCQADGIATSEVFGPDGPGSDESGSDGPEKSYGKVTSPESPQITAHQIVESHAQNCELTRTYEDQTGLRKRLLYPAELRERETSQTCATLAVLPHDAITAREAAEGDSVTSNRHTEVTHDGASLSTLPAPRATLRDLLLAIDSAALAGDLHRVRRLVSEALDREVEARDSLASLPRVP